MRAVLAVLLLGACVESVTPVITCPAHADYVERTATSWRVTLDGSWPQCLLPLADAATPGAALDRCRTIAGLTP